jgi:ketosteroid isomerase-like protein
MMDSELEEFVEQYHRTLEAVVKGDASPQERVWSRRDDVTLANPLGPPARGWTEVSTSLRRAVSQLSDGEVLALERISAYSCGDLAYVLEIERFRVKVAGAREPAPSSLRVTTIFRREEAKRRSARPARAGRLHFNRVSGRRARRASARLR